MKTLAVRMARHNENAMRIAAWLESHPQVSRVFYPGLPSHPDHAIACRQMCGFGGMVCFEVKGGYDRPAAPSTGSRSSSAPPASAGRRASAACRCSRRSTASATSNSTAAGVTRGMIRLSVGLEHVDDLIADLDQALS